ncbi:hypothetical protein C2G38_2215497 [Gigaspora rosea]|uniref:Uncharacterized protein n=1 Tax=Gigaspora rosea TaxID=44941 RepID=A0A397UE51_9GLOM|nr:hypothetical protein C2G38_2215497 [Gigaspora rosea]
MVIVKTRGEIRKERSQAKSNSTCRCTLGKLRIVNCKIVRQNQAYVQASNTAMLNRKKRRKVSVRLKRDHEAEIANIPLRVLEMNKEFNMAAKEYTTWPLPLTHFIRSHILIIKQNWG